MVGLGYRKDIAHLFEKNCFEIDFIEVAPENWIDIGGFWRQKLKSITEDYPLFCHGLSLSIGSEDDIDFSFLKKVRDFLIEYNVSIYSEHLSFSKVDNAHLYDLLPIPFTYDAIKRVSEKILRVQDFLKRKLIIENVSYYTTLPSEVEEVDFINLIIEKTDCELLLDVNNVYVNAFNHQYNAEQFIDKINTNKVRYIHMAGHDKVSDELIIDTHGEPIINPVYQLLDYTLSKIKTDVPILLERDFNFPESEELKLELNKLREIQTKNIRQHGIE